MDCFVAGAPRNDEHAIAISRRITPKVCPKISSPSTRGRGECRVPNAPAAWCALLVVSMHTSIHSGGTGNIRHSPRNGFNAYSVLSPETNSSCLRRRRIDGVIRARLGRHAFTDLTPATGARTTRLRVRINAARLARLSRSLTSLTRPATSCAHDIVASTASRPTLVTTAKRPSWWDGMARPNHRFLKNRS
jgi:hypothetical protein